MNSSPLPFRPRTAVLLLLLGIAGQAQAQLGTPAADWSKLYGRPFLESTNETGTQVLHYRKEGFIIAAFGRNGIALHVRYTKTNLSGSDVQYLLDINRGGALWAPFATAGQSETNPAQAAWMRSDDWAMAVRDGDTLTVTAGEWNRRPPEEPSPPTPETATTALSLPPPAPPPPVPRPSRPWHSPPGKLPAPGANRSAVLSMLGEARGSLRTGSREYLVYEWGHAVLENGRFIKIETAP